MEPLHPGLDDPGAVLVFERRAADQHQFFHERRVPGGNQEGEIGTPGEPDEGDRHGSLFHQDRPELLHLPVKGCLGLERFEDPGTWPRVPGQPEQPHRERPVLRG